MKVEHSIDIEKVKYMKVIIIGGGAAGMMAALSAREQGAEVTILERQARVGKKLLATGNGRCNLSNTKLTLKNYHGQDARFADYALSSFDTETTLKYFENLLIPSLISSTI